MKIENQISRLFGNQIFNVNITLILQGKWTGYSRSPWSSGTLKYNMPRCQKGSSRDQESNPRTHILLKHRDQVCPIPQHCQEA